MTEPNRKTKTITVTISEQLNKQIEKDALNNGEFSNFSDFIGTVVAEFVGKMYFIQQIPGFDYRVLNEYLENKEKISIKRSISINNHLDSQLHNLSYVTKLKKNVIIRICIYDYFLKINQIQSPLDLIDPNPEIIDPKRVDMPSSKDELETFIKRIIEDTVFK